MCSGLTTQSRVSAEFKQTFTIMILIDSAPRLGVYYFLSLTLSVCGSVTPLQIASSFLFLDGIEPFFGRQFSMWHSTKRCSLILDLATTFGRFLHKIKIASFLNLNGIEPFFER